MLRIPFRKRPQPFSTAGRKNRCLQLRYRPFNAALNSRRVSLITLDACCLSFDSPVTRITGSVPLSRTRTQASSALTLSPNFVSTEESFPRILLNPEAREENIPFESLPEYFIPSRII